jgi:hypothetical protein
MRGSFLEMGFSYGLRIEELENGYPNQQPELCFGSGIACPTT